MATLVAPLVTGFSDAASGTAEFYSRGTSTLSSQVYSDVNGQTAVTTHVLDSRGRITRYVEEIVDVVVKNASGATVATWTEVVDARTVRMESAAFTGSNPNGNGQTIASGMTTLHSGFALYRESLGTDDGYVNINGTDYLIKNALASSSGVFYNVKTGYGAVGNGTSNDTSAIQSAINAAANAGGGIVFFPPGTYLITSALTISSTMGIQLLGVSSNFSAQVSEILCSTNGLTAMLDIHSSRTRVTGLAFIAGGDTVTTPCLAATDTAAFLEGVSVEACSFTPGNAAAVHVKCAQGFSPAASFSDCSFVSLGVNSKFAASGSTTSNFGIAAHFQGCRFDTRTFVPASALFDDNRYMFSGCVINLSSTSGGATVFAACTQGYFQLNGCDVQVSNTSGTNVLFGTSARGSFVGGIVAGSSGTFNFVATVAGASQITEACSIIPVAVGNLGSCQWSQTYEARAGGGSITGTSYTPDNLTYSQFHLTHTSGASMAFGNPSTSVPYGARLLIVYENTTGGNITPTWGTAYSGVPATAVNNGNSALYEFRYSGVVGSGEFICVTTSPVVAAA